MKLLVLSLTLALATFDLGMTYPTYVPESQCASMSPMHYTNETAMTGPIHQPQAIDPYFRIDVSMTTDVKPGQRITITIQTTEADKYFEGFLIQAHRETGWTTWENRLFGDFVSYNSDTQLACQSRSVCHKVHKHYDNATFDWTAPAVDKSTNFHFVATIVKGYSTYFVNVTSPLVQVVPADSDSQTNLTPFCSLLVLALATALFLRN